ncbi:MAG: ribonuclease III [Woeseiaceae bacterium]|nr:ribonuclease III [Woeseiaceae bacterium]
MQEAATWLKQTLDYEFEDSDLLQRALTHRSASGRNNERLEFLGDSVLQLVVSELVFDERRGASEGRLSRLRSTLVKDQTLSEISAELGLGKYLVLGSGEKKSGGYRRLSILADALEALFGAVYLDRGFDAARRVIYNAFGERVRDLPEEGELRDPKSLLQEYLQGRHLPLPVYSMEKVSGKAHKQFFEVSCTTTKPELKTAGSGSTRRDAEQQAAVAMLAVVEKELG